MQYNKSITILFKRVYPDSRLLLLPPPPSEPVVSGCTLQALYMFEEKSLYMAFVLTMLSSIEDFFSNTIGGASGCLGGNAATGAGTGVAGLGAYHCHCWTVMTRLSQCHCSFPSASVQPSFYPPHTAWRTIPFSAEFFSSLRYLQSHHRHLCYH
jgi:hypothetical protein